MCISRYELTSLVTRRGQLVDQRTSVVDDGKGYANKQIEGFNTTYAQRSLSRFFFFFNTGLKRLLNKIERDTKTLKNKNTVHNVFLDDLG